MLLAVISSMQITEHLPCANGRKRQVITIKLDSQQEVCCGKEMHKLTIIAKCKWAIEVWLELTHVATLIHTVSLHLKGWCLWFHLLRLDSLVQELFFHENQWFKVLSTVTRIRLKHITVLNLKRIKYT